MQMEIQALQTDVQSVLAENKNKDMTIERLEQEKQASQAQIICHQQKIMTLKTEIQVLRDSYGKFNSKLECFER